MLSFAEICRIQNCDPNSLQLIATNDLLFRTGFRGSGTRLLLQLLRLAVHGRRLRSEGSVLDSTDEKSSNNTVNRQLGKTRERFRDRVSGCFFEID